MNALTRFEDMADHLLQGLLPGSQKQRLQPVEIAKRLARAMDDDRLLAAGYWLVPDDYQVEIHPQLFQDWTPVAASLEKEMAEYLLQAARELSYGFQTNPAVHLKAGAQLRNQRDMRVTTQFTSPGKQGGGGPMVTPQPLGPIDPTGAMPTVQIPGVPVAGGGPSVGAVPGQPAWGLEVDGRLVPLAQNTLNIGRMLQNDVVASHTSVSRRHAQVIWRGGRYILVDLRSANGTRVNGQRIQEHVLQENDHIRIGDVEMVFKRL
ncbi:MAG: DUF3662 domain-containing protein [Chloroflexi bacterium]|nr:DUF3662 domain-containing protein [Chloroflexota bacterium]